MYIVGAKKIFKKDSPHYREPEWCLYAGNSSYWNHYTLFCKSGELDTTSYSLLKKPQIYATQRSAQKAANSLLNNKHHLREVSSSRVIQMFVEPTVWVVSDYLKEATIARLQGKTTHPSWITE